tara:strand:+ start:1340 stop:1762 length:423 start_codon:yes stop_codon:yes gene_type:complete
MVLGLHPALVHFPIAFIVLSFIFQLITILIPKRVPDNLTLWALIPAAVSTIPTVISGQSMKNKINNLCVEAQKSLEVHEVFANITTWGSLFICIIWIFITLNKKNNHSAQKLLFAYLTLLFVSVMITGYYGGLLVHVWEI